MMQDIYTLITTCSTRIGVNMGYWNSRGLRGSCLEEDINYTNELYKKKSWH